MSFATFAELPLFLPQVHIWHSKQWHSKKHSELCWSHFSKTEKKQFSEQLKYLTTFVECNSGNSHFQNWKCFQPDLQKNQNSCKKQLFRRSPRSCLLASAELHMKFSKNTKSRNSNIRHFMQCHTVTRMKLFPNLSPTKAHRRLKKRKWRVTPSKTTVDTGVFRGYIETLTEPPQQLSAASGLLYSLYCCSKHVSVMYNTFLIKPLIFATC